MKITVTYKQCEEAELQLCIPQEDRDTEETRQLLAGLHRIGSGSHRIKGNVDKTTILLEPAKVLYFEYVDHRVYAYLED